MRQVLAQQLIDEEEKAKSTTALTGVSGAVRKNKPKPTPRILLTSLNKPKHQRRKNKPKHKPKPRDCEANAVSNEEQDGACNAEQTAHTKPAMAQESDADTCVICLDAESTHLLYPCGHQCVCESCATTLVDQDAAAPLCPVCREDIIGSCRVFKP